MIVALVLVLAAALGVLGANFHLISTLRAVGPPETRVPSASAAPLPAVLNQVGAAVPLVTPKLASQVTRALWDAHEQARAQRNTATLQELDTPGAELAYDLTDFTGNYQFLVPPRQRPYLTDSMLVPAQSDYPLTFLGQVETTEEVTTGDATAPPTLSPWVDLVVITKASVNQHWRIAFETGYVPKMASSPFFLLGQAGQPQFDPPPAFAAVVPSQQFAPLLAAYWQSYVMTGAHRQAPHSRPGISRRTSAPTSSDRTPPGTTTSSTSSTRSTPPIPNGPSLSWVESR